jgi:hypothetical protein
VAAMMASGVFILRLLRISIHFSTTASLSGITFDISTNNFTAASSLETLLCQERASIFVTTDIVGILSITSNVTDTRLPMNEDGTGSKTFVLCGIIIVLAIIQIVFTKIIYFSAFLFFVFAELVCF